MTPRCLCSFSPWKRFGLRAGASNPALPYLLSSDFVLPRLSFRSGKEKHQAGQHKPGGGGFCGRFRAVRLKVRTRNNDLSVEMPPLLRCFPISGDRPP